MAPTHLGAGEYPRGPPARLVSGAQRLGRRQLLGADAGRGFGSRRPQPARGTAEVERGAMTAPEAALTCATDLGHHLLAEASDTV